MTARTTTRTTTRPTTRTRQTTEPVQQECCDVVSPAFPIAVPDDDTLAAMAKALAHPARVRILRMLEAQQACVTGDVVSEIGLAQSTVSEHLRILREAGLIQGEIEGPRTRYCVNATGLATLKIGIAAL